MGNAFKIGVGAFNKGDYATALEEWVPLAGQGDNSAQFNLGLMYMKGTGVPQDDETAIRWFTLAAEQGDADAQFSLGFMYKEEPSVPLSEKTSFRWVKLAAEQGHNDAQKYLGSMYLAEPDYDNAFAWFKLSAEQGDAAAQNVLGFLYFEGKETQEDLDHAYMWFNLAAAQGGTSANKNLEILEEKMSPAQLETAQKFSREWREEHQVITRPIIPLEEEMADTNGITLEGEKTKLKATKYPSYETTHSWEFEKTVLDVLASDREWSNGETSKTTMFILKSIIAVGVIGTIVTTVYWLYVFYQYG